MLKHFSDKRLTKFLNQITLFSHFPVLHFFYNNHNENINKHSSNHWQWLIKDGKAFKKLCDGKSRLRGTNRSSLQDAALGAARLVTAADFNIKQPVKLSGCRSRKTRKDFRFDSSVRGLAAPCCQQNVSQNNKSASSLQNWCWLN